MRAQKKVEGLWFLLVGKIIFLIVKLTTCYDQFMYCNGQCFFQEVIHFMYYGSENDRIIRNRLVANSAHVK